MAVYKFRAIWEENDDVYRDIEIKSIQTFEDLHHAILEAIKFDKKHAASFFVSDDYWRKNQEITLRKEDLALDAEEIKKKVSPKKLMSETKIAKYIEQPHQRFVYVYDADAQWCFLLELIKIDSENPKTKYPVCVKSAGKEPKQYKTMPVIKDEPTGEDALLAALLGGGKKKAKEEEDDGEENEIYKSLKSEGIEEDDLNTLEGEEGEETGEEGEEEESFSDDEEGDGGEDYGFESDGEDER